MKGISINFIMVFVEPAGSGYPRVIQMIFSGFGFMSRSQDVLSLCLSRLETCFGLLSSITSLKDEHTNIEGINPAAWYYCTMPVNPVKQNYRI